jgi:hypothetical protein
LGRGSKLVPCHLCEIKKEKMENNQGPQLISLEQRLVRLERVNKGLLIFIIAILIIVFSIGALPNKNGDIFENIVARSFTLVDAAGNKRAHIISNQAGAEFAVFDGNQKIRIEIVSDEQGDFLMLNDKKGTNRVVLTAPQHNKAEITLYDESHGDTWSAP